MTIYAVFLIVDHNGADLLGLFTTLAKANAAYSSAIELRREALPYVPTVTLPTHIIEAIEVQ